jgi:uncharacterized membrane protein
MSILVIIGGLLALVGGIWLIVKAFQDSMFWGICCLFIPMATLLFAVLHWDDVKVPFFLNLGGIILIALPHFL